MLSGRLCEKSSDIRTQSRKEAAMFALLAIVVVPVVLYLLGFWAIFKTIKVSTFALVRTIGVNKSSLVVCAAVVALYVLTYGRINGILGTLLALATIPCACLLWWFAIRWVMDNSNNITAWIDKWSLTYADEAKKAKQRRREQSNRACEMFDKGYNDIVNGK